MKKTLLATMTVLALAASCTDIRDEAQKHMLQAVADYSMESAIVVDKTIKTIISNDSLVILQSEVRFPLEDGSFDRGTFEYSYVKDGATGEFYEFLGDTDGDGDIHMPTRRVIHEIKNASEQKKLNMSNAEYEAYLMHSWALEKSKAKGHKID